MVPSQLTLFTAVDGLFLCYILITKQNIPHPKTASLRDVLFGPTCSVNTLARHLKKLCTPGLGSCTEGGFTAGCARTRATAGTKSQKHCKRLCVFLLFCADTSLI